MSAVTSSIWYAFFPVAEPLYNAGGWSRTAAGVSARAGRRAIAFDILIELFRCAFNADPLDPLLHELPTGKPYFSTRRGTTHVSLSYAGGWGAAALSEDDVGIDIEARTLRPGWAQRVNALAGHNLIAASGDPLRSWVRIEASIKLFGGSITDDLPRIRIEPGSDDGWRAGVQLLSASSFWIRDVDAPDTHRAALAARRAKSLIHVPIGGKRCRSVS